MVEFPSPYSARLHFGEYKVDVGAAYEFIQVGGLFTHAGEVHPFH
jgi:hypothetical protein